MKKITAAITGVGAFLPKDVLTNQDLEQIVDTNDEWIQTRTGIRERRIMRDADKSTGYMGAEAVKDLLKKKNISPLDVELIIVATTTPDNVFPATANSVCEMAGAKNAWSYDISAACSSFLYALITGAQFIESGMHKKVIVVGSDKMSAITDYTDRSTCILFGDAGGAVLLEPNVDGFGILDARLYGDGGGKQYLFQKSGGSLRPPSIETVQNREHFVYQDGQPVFKRAVVGMADVSEEIMKRNNLKGDDIAYLVPHQANKRIIDACAKRMGIGSEKVMLNIERYGNTTSATIPLCLWEWEKKLKRGDNLILATFGAGFTWGAVYVKWAY